MSNVNNVVTFCEMHIKKLKEELSSIYTISTPEEYTNYDKSEINVLEHLSYLENMEKVYVSIEKAGFSTGEVYERYNKYLLNVRKGIGILKKAKQEIDESRKADIGNIYVLLNAFQTQLSLQKK